jgi:hypothetical protein
VADKYLDTMTGGAGSLASHTPDVAPTGFSSYSLTSGPALNLDGSGNLVPAASGNGIARAEGLTLTLTHPFTMRMHAVVREDGQGAWISIESATPGDNSIGFRLLQLDSATSELRVYTNGASRAYYQEVLDMDIVATYQSDGTVDVSINGVPQDPAALDPADLSYVNVQLRLDSAGGTPASTTLVSLSDGAGAATILPQMMQHHA